MTITTPQEIPRDRWGRPQVVPPDGGKPTAYTRCTTYVSVLEDTFNLNKWMQRMVATGLAGRPDLLLAVSGAQDDKNALNKICDDAREAAQASAAATTGTALHSLTEILDRGGDMPPVPEAYKADIEAYQQATSDLTAQYIEQFTVLDDLKIGGTPDRIVQLNGQTFIADIKTGGIEYGIGKIAMQLAVYSRSQGYRFDTNERFSLGNINQDTGIIIHLPAGKGTCELVEVDLNAGWQAVQIATQVREWRKRKDLSRPLAQGPQPAPAASPEPERDMAVVYLEDKIANATSLEELRQLWVDHQTIWSDDQTSLAAARKALLEGKAA